MTLSEIKAELQKNNEFSYSFAARKTGLNKGEIWRAVNKGIYPRAKWKREVLGLPCLAEAPVCPEHGVVHLGKCPARRRKRKPPPAMTPEVEEHLRIDLCLGEWKIIDGKMWMPLDGIIDALKKQGFDKKGYRLVHRNTGEK